MRGVPSITRHSRFSGSAEWRRSTRRDRPLLVALILLAALFIAVGDVPGFGSGDGAPDPGGAGHPGPVRARRPRGYLARLAAACHPRPPVRHRHRRRRADPRQPRLQPLGDRDSPATSSPPFPVVWVVPIALAANAIHFRPRLQAYAAALYVVGLGGDRAPRRQPRLAERARRPLATRACCSARRRTSCASSC